MIKRGRGIDELFKNEFNSYQKGSGWLEDLGNTINDGLKKTHILSNIGSVVLPLAGGAVGSLFSPVGTAVGTAVGASANEGLKSLGYGRQMSSGYVGQVGCYTEPIPMKMIF